jgi:ATP-dependent RNA helicase DDX52/ROK1
MTSDIVISTPLRLVSSIQSGHLSLHKYVQVHTLVSTAVFICRYLGSVRHLILDEADRMLDQEFITQIQDILAACTHERLQTAVFSATLPAGAERIALDMLRDPIRVVVGLKCVHLLRWYSHSL